MEDNLSKLLENDEYLIWQGKPEAFETLDNTYKKHFVRRIVGAVAAAVVLIVLYLVAIHGRGVEVNYFLIAAVIILSAISPLTIFSYASKLRKKAVYAATNQRLIVYTGDMKAVNYSYIKEAAFKTDDDGHTSFLCGKAGLEAPSSAWRMICLFGFNDLEAKDGPVCERFAFYAMENPEEFKEAVASYLPIIK